MGKLTAKQTTTTIRIVNNNKEIKYFKLHNHMYVLVDLVFVIKRNWELCMGSCYPSRISWTCNQHIYNSTGNY